MVVRKLTPLVVLITVMAGVHAQSGDPPCGEPFFLKLGSDSGRHCVHGTDSTWSVAGNKPVGWVKLPHPYTWLYNPDNKDWIYAVGVGPNSHYEVHIWLTDDTYQGPSFPFVDADDPLLFIDYDAPSRWKKEIITQSPGIGNPEE